MAEQPTTHRPRRRWLRRTLLALGPAVALAASGWLYITGGRYVGTDDAYLKAGTVQISPEVDGRIAAVLVDENQHVIAGQVLLRLDSAPFRIALARADAQLAQARADIASLEASWRQTREQLIQAQTTEAFQAREYKRQSDLAAKRMASQSQLDQARQARDVARQQVAVLRQALAGIVARLGGDPNIPVEQHAEYRQAEAARDAAALDLQHTVLRAPAAGVVGHVPQPGNYVKTGDPVLSLVRDDDVWLEANIKETDLAHVRTGEKATVTVDAYPGREWHGHVQSISQATGAEFALLPPQNATGNWVKVVQRVPVRITIDGGAGAPPLRAGMSTSVEIDTGYRRPLPGVLATIAAWLDPPAARAATGQ